MSELARKEELAEIDADGKSALAALDPEWVKPIGFFCMVHLDLIRSRGPLVANIKVWKARGLTLEDLKSIMRVMVEPEAAQNYRNERELMADMRVRVSRVFKARRLQREAAQRREEATAPGGKAATILSFADGFKMPGREQTTAPPIGRKRA